jgi:diacylglycerol O-acyltransferase / wax synthase
MERLSAQDAGFLYTETPETPMHVGSLTVFAPTQVSFETILQKFRDHTVARFDLLPSYRRRLQAAPLNLDHPVWVREENIDLDYHIQHRTLSPPGTIAQLRALTADLLAVPLDRARPLWQYHLIDGLESGGFAVYMNVHHAAMDGVAGMMALPVIYDFSPEPTPLAASNLPPTEPEAEGWLPALGAALDGMLQQNLRLAQAGPKLVSALTKIGRRAARASNLLPGASELPPRTLFNVSISRDRTFGTATVPLSVAKRIAKTRLATINDVVLTICAGALRRYLASKKALPAKSLVAGVPATLRDPSQIVMNNQSTMLLCTLATDRADPIERLNAIATASQASRQQLQDTKELIATDISVFGAPLVMGGLSQLASRTHIYDVLPPLMNVVISNVPGPRQPMYCAGVAAMHYFPLSIAYHNAALNITVQSYLDNLDFGLVACQTTVPDVQRIGDLIVEECEVLKDAVAAIEREISVSHVEIVPRSVPAPSLVAAAPAGAAHLPPTATAAVPVLVETPTNVCRDRPERMPDDSQQIVTAAAQIDQIIKRRFLLRIMVTVGGVV